MMESETHIIQPQKTDREILEAIHENTRKTKNYMKWSLIITVAFVVIPLVAALVMIPIALKSVTSIYSSYGIENLIGSDPATDGGSVQDIIDQYTK